MMGKNVWFPTENQVNGQEEDTLLFCFPHAGGSSNTFRPWLHYKEPGIHAVPIELPGKGMRCGEQAACDLNELARQAALKIALYARNRRIALYGHSMGAVLAFQVEYELENSFGIQSSGLAVSGRCAPMEFERSRFFSWMGMDALVQELRRLQTLPEELLSSKEYLDYFLPVIMEDYKLHESYQYSNEKISADIYAFASEEDSGADPVIMQKWKNVTIGDFQLTAMHGNHFFVYERKEQFYSELCRQLLNK